MSLTIDKQNTLLLFLDYITHEKKYSEHTIKAYKKDLEQFANFINQTFDIENITLLSHVFIRSWIVELLGQNLTKQTINRKISVLKSYFKFLVDRSYLEESPVIKVIVPKMKRKRAIAVQKKELNLLENDSLWEQDFKGLRDRLIVELLYGTGMRRSELIQTKIEDVLLEQGIIKILGKRNKERLVPLSKGLQNLIINYITVRNKTFPDTSESSLILTNKGKKAYAALIYKVVRHYLSLVTNLKKRSPHVLRHSFATHLMDNGADLVAIKEILGHKSLSSTEIYTHNSIERLRAVYNQTHPKGKTTKI